MKAYVMKLENNCVIVDEEYFNEIKKQSEFNQERISEIAEEKYLKYIKDGSTINLTYQINGVPYIFRRDLVDELNYSERDHPISVTNKIKFAIADDITEFLNNKFKGLKDDALNYALSEFNKQQYGLKATVKIWKLVGLIACIMAAVLLIVIFIKP
jgi:hypothetical protein